VSPAKNLDHLMPDVRICDPDEGPGAYRRGLFLVSVPFR
jgi:hypothetical protein